MTIQTKLDAMMELHDEAICDRTNTILQAARLQGVSFITSSYEPRRPLEDALRTLLEENEKLRAAAQVALTALRTCGYESSGAHYAYFDDDEVEDAIAILEALK